MSNDANTIRANRLRAMAHEMLALADELEEKYTKRRGNILAYEFASLQALGARAAQDFVDRQRRGMSFEGNLFGEPAWDILLYLFVKKVEKRKVSVTQATGASGVATTTALRYLAILEEAKLVDSTVSLTDSRVRFVELTVEGTMRMSQCLARQLRFERTGCEKLDEMIEGNPRRAANDTNLASLTGKQI